jgi:hypothetical protein
MIIHPAIPGDAATTGPIDVGPWQTSSYSGNGQECVEVAPFAAGVLLRDTKDHGTGPVLSFTAAQWAQFLQETRTGTTGENGAVVVTHTAAGTEVRAADGDTILRFTPGEWTAFRDGVRDREFDTLAA